MNWGLIGWVAKVALTLGGIKFVVFLWRRLFSKASMERTVKNVNDSAYIASDHLTDYLAKKVEKRRAEKEAKKEQKPVVIIR